MSLKHAYPEVYFTLNFPEEIPEEEAVLTHEARCSNKKLYITHICIMAYRLQSAFICIISFAIRPLECLRR